MLVKKYATNLVYITLITACSTRVSADYLQNHTYYYGGAAGIEQINFKQDYGKNFFAKNTLGFELFINAQHPDKFGFEIAAGFTPDKSKKPTIKTGDRYPGTAPLQAGVWETWQPQYQTQFIYAGINRYVPYSFNAKLRFFGFAGLSITKVHAKIEFINDDLNFVPTAEQIDRSKRTYSDVKFVPILKVGMEYHAHKNYGCRAVYTWKNYAVFDSIKSNEKPGNTPEIRLANVNAIYFGIFYKF